MNNSRISTGMVYNQSVSLMLAKQSQLAKLQTQLATGEKITTAKDNPVAAGNAVALDRAVAELDRMGENATNVQNRLGLQENVLAQAGDLAISIKELTIQANNDALSSDDLKAIAAELKATKATLISLANSTDGNGRYLFAGAADDSVPFTVANGVVNYNGDQTQRTIEVAPGTYVKDALPGSEVFMRVRTGNGTVDGSAATTNTGAAVLGEVTRDGSSTWDGSSYTVRFTAPGAYEVVDSTNTVVSAGSYTVGEPIVAGGIRFSLEGAPDAGDSFAVGPAQTRDVFTTLDQLIATLEMDTSSPSAKAAQHNQLQSGLRDVSRIAETLIDARASGGAQLLALDNADALRESNLVTLKSTLSGMRDLDYAEAISEYQLENTALEAAQTIFTQMQSMSLFNMIR